MEGNIEFSKNCDGNGLTEQTIPTPNEPDLTYN